MITPDDAELTFRLLSQLPKVVPDMGNEERIRKRCHEALAHQAGGLLQLR